MHGLEPRKIWFECRFVSPGLWPPEQVDLIFWFLLLQVLRTKTKPGIIPIRGLLCSYKCFNSEGHDYFGIAYVGDTWWGFSWRYIQIPCQELQPFLEWNTNGIVARSDWLPFPVIPGPQLWCWASKKKIKSLPFYWLIMRAFSWHKCSRVFAALNLKKVWRKWGTLLSHFMSLACQWSEDKLDIVSSSGTNSTNLYNWSDRFVGPIRYLNQLPID